MSVTPIARQTAHQVQYRGESAMEVAGTRVRHLPVIAGLARPQPPGPGAEYRAAMPAGLPQASTWLQSSIAADAIIALLPEAERQHLIAEFLDRGGAWPLASALDNLACLEFLAPRLDCPSHARSLCRMALALDRAWVGAAMFVEPEYRVNPECSRAALQDRIELEAWCCIERMLHSTAATRSWEHIARNAWDSVERAVWDGVERDARGRIEHAAWQFLGQSARNRIERGPYASLVWFHARPEEVLRALHGSPLPEVGAPTHAVLCGPGVPNTCRAATPEEIVLWASLPSDDTAPELVERLLVEGIIVYAEQ